MRLVRKSWFPYVALAVAFFANLINLFTSDWWVIDAIAVVAMAFMVLAGYLLHRNRRALDAYRAEMERRLQQ